MKQIIFVMAISLCLTTTAQKRDTSTWYQHLQTKTVLLNSTQILTGRLYDRVPQAISPLKFKGEYIDSLNKLNHTDFKQIFWQHCGDH